MSTRTTITAEVQAVLEAGTITDGVRQRLTNGTGLAKSIALE